MSTSAATAQHILNSLTEKQREVLDRLIQHKTSKEIARELGISPHTVDQRIQFSKKKLNVGSRREAAERYRELNRIYERPIYEESRIGDGLMFTKEGACPDEYVISNHCHGDENTSLERHLEDVTFDRDAKNVAQQRQYLSRFLLILMLSGSTLLVALGSIAIFVTLSEYFELLNK